MTVSQYHDANLSIGELSSTRTAGDTATHGKQTRVVPRVSQDRLWEAELLSYLSALESCRARLESPEASKDPNIALAALVQMASHTTALAENQFSAEDYTSDLTNLLALSGDFFTAADQVRSGLQQSRSWFSWMRGRTDQVALSEQLRRTAVLLVDVLTGHFVLFGARFGAQASVRRWQETSAVFLTDLKDMLGLSQKKKSSRS